MARQQSPLSPFPEPKISAKPSRATLYTVYCTHAHSTQPRLGAGAPGHRTQARSELSALRSRSQPAPAALPSACPKPRPQPRPSSSWLLASIIAPRFRAGLLLRKKMRKGTSQRRTRARARTDTIPDVTMSQKLMLRG